MGLIRVLHIVTKMYAAGIETLIMNIYRNIERNKIQFDFLTHRDGKGFYDEEILELGGDIYHVPPINPFNHHKYLKALDIFFSDHKDYRIVHSHINTYSMYPLRAAMKAHIPIRIAHSHIADVPIDLKTPFRIYTKSKLKYFSTHNFACSKIAGIWLFGEEEIKKNNFKVVNDSINPLLFSYNEKIRKRVKSDAGLDGRFIIGHIGRFSKQKNHKFLIDIFKVVHDKIPDAILMLIGDGELRQKVEEKALALGLKNNIIFAGVRSDIEELLQAMDVFVFPSLYEGLGLVVIEAQAAGLHCIVSDTIPKEVYVTDLIEKVSLNSSAELWAKKILKYVSGYKRVNKYKQIKKMGYDIKDTAKFLEEFYLKNWKG
jgi:glycosyltransferase involved in cell wall biosynthesis